MKSKKQKVIPWMHQKECLTAITAARRRGNSVTLFVMASGLGKTFTSAFDFRRFRKKHPGARLLFLAHQNDLLEQAKISYKEVFGCSLTYGSFNSYAKETRAEATFATFQSLREALFVKRKKGRRPFGKKRFEYIVVDESHHGQAPTYRDVIDYFNSDFMLGMTATPDRMDMLDIREIFGDEVFTLDLEEALIRGLLTPVDYRVLADEIVDKGELSVPPHRVTVQKLNRIFFARKRDEEIVQIILDRTKDISDARIIVFDASIEHAEMLIEMIPGSVTIHSSVSRTEREKRMEWIRRGIARVAVTVDQFNEGIDIPEANVLVFLRSTQSDRIFKQQLGRGLRKLAGKKKVLVLDFVANCERLVMLDDLRQALEKSQTVQHRRSPRGEHEIFSVDWGKVVFTERAQQITELLHEVKLPLSSERLLRYLQDFYSKHGRSPQKRDLGPAKGYPSTNTYIRFFGGLSKACVLAGIPESALSSGQLRILFEQADDEYLLSKLKEFYKKHKRAPLTDEFKHKNGLPSVMVYYNRFGSPLEACMQAGIPKQALNDAQRLIFTQRGLATKEYLDKLRWFFRKHGRSPLSKELHRSNKMPSYVAYLRKFGDLPTAFRLAGIPVGKQWVMTSKQLITMLKSFYQQHGRAPKYNELGPKKGMPTYQVYSKYFGSFAVACKKAGIPYVAKGSISDKKALQALKKFYQSHKRIPKRRDLPQEKFGLLSSSVYVRRFGGLLKACHLAGIPEKAFSQRQLEIIKKRTIKKGERNSS